MRPDSVLLAYVHEDIPSGSFGPCLLDLIGYDMANSQHLAEAGWLAMRSGTDGVAGARNKVVRSFVESGAEWLFWLDDDMGFAPDTLDRLLEAADPVERPIVGALCFAMRHTGMDGLHGWDTMPNPVIYDWSKDENDLGFTARRDYSRHAVVQCGATGSACLVVHRSVYEKVGAKYLPQGQAWYDRVKLKPETWGDGATVMAEDLSFCLRAADVGCPTFVHTGVPTTHAKTVWLDEGQYLASAWPAPATDRVAVIVPVLSRPQNAAPFMESLRASTGLANAYFICDPDDDEEIEAARVAGARVLLHTGAHGTFAAKANFGYRNTTEPWLLLVGDDVIFRPGWYDRALRSAGSRFDVVGTQDLSGIKRDLAVHPLIRRCYVDELGASWDGPGVIAHEGYRHNFVDNEWTAVAMERGALVLAPDAVVEHMHPIFKKGEVDAVYEKGYSNYDRDKRLWEKRSKAHHGRTATADALVQAGMDSADAIKAVEKIRPDAPHGGYVPEVATSDVGFSLEASVAAYRRQWEEVPGLIKVHEDLERYERIVKDTQPEVIVETGTYSGLSACWFAELGPEVITVDTYTDHGVDLADMPPHDRVTYIKGSSTDPDVVTKVVEMVGGRRCMVVLDSDHTADHVAAELLAYSKVVTPGCYLVVEDTIVRWVPGTPVTEFGPMDAVEAFFLRPGWVHDDDLQNLHPVSHHPCGWWRKAS